MIRCSRCGPRTAVHAPSHKDQRWRRCSGGERENRYKNGNYHGQAPHFSAALEEGFAFAIFPSLASNRSLSSSQLRSLATDSNESLVLGFAFVFLDSILGMSGDPYNPD